MIAIMTMTVDRFLLWRIRIVMLRRTNERNRPMNTGILFFRQFVTLIFVCRTANVFTRGSPVSMRAALHPVYLSVCLFIRPVPPIFSKQ